MEMKAKNFVNRIKIDRRSDRRFGKERSTKKRYCDVLATQTKTNSNSSVQSTLEDSDYDIDQEPNYALHLRNFRELKETESFALLTDIDKVLDILIDEYDKHEEGERKNGADERADEQWESQETAGFELLETVESSVDYLLSSTRTQTKPTFEFHGRWTEMILQPFIDPQLDLNAKTPSTKPQPSTTKNHEDEVRFEMRTGETRNFLTINIDGRIYRALFDSGAQSSLIVSSAFYYKYKQQLYPTEVCLEGLYNKCRKADGELDVEIDIDGHAGAISFAVIKLCKTGDTEEIILGMDFINEFDFEAKLARGFWRVHDGEWHKFSKQSSDDEVHLRVKSLWPCSTRHDVVTQ